MGILDNLNDDQIALLGCGVALLLCGGAMVVSYSMRQWISRTTAQHQPPTAREDAAAAEETPAETRKAA